jgi:predicted MFS family arabinose efflux permease
MAWSHKSISLNANGLLCGVLFGRAVAGAVGDQYGWCAMFWLGCRFAIATGILLAAILPRSRPKSRDRYPTSEVASHFVTERAELH